jgi:hypothetical protein
LNVCLALLHVAINILYTSRHSNLDCLFELSFHWWAMIILLCSLTVRLDSRHRLLLVVENSASSLPLLLLLVLFSSSQSGQKTTCPLFFDTLPHTGRKKGSIFFFFIDPMLFLYRSCSLIRTTYVHIDFVWANKESRSCSIKLSKYRILLS